MATVTIAGVGLEYDADGVAYIVAVGRIATGELLTVRTPARNPDDTVKTAAQIKLDIKADYLRKKAERDLLAAIHAAGPGTFLDS